MALVASKQDVTLSPENGLNASQVPKEIWTIFEQKLFQFSELNHVNVVHQILMS